MRKWLYFLLALVVVWSCQKKKEKKQEPISTAKQEEAKFQVNSAKPDTVYETAYLDKEKYYDTTSIKVGKDVYISLSEAVSLNDSSIVETFSWDNNNTIHKAKQHNNLYKIKLLKNGNTLLERQFTKHDFLKLEKENPYIQGSVPRPLVLAGVTTEGKLLFDIQFGLPDSDVGGISTLVTDIEGKPLLLQNYNHTGGGGCDSELQLTSNRKYFLNCETLYGPNNYKFNFAKEDVVYAKFLTDTTFVVIYDYVIKRGYRMENGVDDYFEERDTVTNNLVFYHVNGSRLANDVYRGFYQELGYTAPVELVGKSFATLDGRKKEVVIYPIGKPQESKKILLSSAKKLKQRIKNPAVEEINLRTYENTYYLYLFPDGLQYFESEE